jgi:hypothetical protein
LTAIHAIRSGRTRTRFFYPKEKCAATSPAFDPNPISQLIPT